MAISSVLMACWQQLFPSARTVCLSRILRVDSAGSNFRVLYGLCALYSIYIPTFIAGDWRSFGDAGPEELGSILRQYLYGMQTTDASKFFRAEADIAKSDVCTSEIISVALEL